MTVSAKVICDSKSEHQNNEGAVVEARVHFQPDYADGRNAEWAMATPHLSLDMTLNGPAAAYFVQGERYTLFFEFAPQEEPDMSTNRPLIDNPFVDPEAASDEQGDHEKEMQNNIERNEEFKEMREKESDE